MLHRLSLLGLALAFTADVQAQEPVKDATAKPALSPAMQQFERRRQAGRGVFLDNAELRKHEDSKKLHLVLKTLSGARVYNYRSSAYLASGRPPGASVGSSGRPIQRSTQGLPSACYVQVYLDGARIYAMGTGETPTDFNTYEVREFQAIEFYRAGIQTPTDFNQSTGECGTLVLWSRER